MAFPVSPLNGNITTIAGKQYIYDSTLGTWTGNLTPVAGNLVATGNASVAGNVNASSVYTINGGQLTGYHTGAIGANTANTGTFTSASITNSTAATSTSTGALQVTGGVGIGGNVYIGGNLTVTGTTTSVNTEIVTATEYATQLIANGGASSTSTTTGALQVQGGGGITGNLYIGGQVFGYLSGAIGANTANSGAFTSITATLTAGITGNLTAGNITASGSGGQVIGYHTGAIGANTANTGVFTTLTVNNSANLGSNANVIITGGSTNTYLKTDGAGNLSWATVTAVAAAAGANTQVQFNDGGTTTAGATYLQYNKTSGNLVSNSTTTSIGVTNGALVVAGGVGIGGNLYVGSSIMPNSNGTQNLGSSSQKWGTLYGTSTTAQYADLAERYNSDNNYEPGTVVVFGGDYEITTTETTHDTRVAGVISTDPAYLMNDVEQEGIWLPVALQGRVPCKVFGPVSKGDVLVSSDILGAATKMVKDFYEPGCVIGKSLEDHADNSIKTIEIAIGRF